MPHTSSIPPRHRALCLLLALVLSLHALLLLSPTAHAAPTATLALSAQAAILLDADSGNVLYEQHASTRLPMASTTKIMTALVVAEQLDPSTPVCIDRRAVGIEGSSIYLYEGEWLTVEQLLLGLLLESANDAAVALAIATADDVAAFAELMNKKAAALGLINTHFENPHGLDADTHYTTAHDLAIIAAEALKNPTLRRIMSTRRATIPLCDMQSPEKEIDLATDAEPSALVGTRVLLNHNKMLRYYDGAIGVKTGYTKEQAAVIGDRIYTDIKSGLNAGILTILVLSGESTLQTLAESDVEPHLVLEDASEILAAIK